MKILSISILFCFLFVGCLSAQHIATFTGTPTSGPAPLTVSFTSHSGSFVNNGWHWDFGDGNTATTRHATHTYTVPGTYTVTHQVFSVFGNLSRTYPDYITVLSPATPIANLTGTPTTGFGPLTVSFTDQSTQSPTSWLWDFGDGITSTEQHPTHTFTTPGIYTINLTVTNATGTGAVTMADYITVQSISSQILGAQQIITTSAGNAVSVYTTDLDGDGDTDVLSAGSDIAWYENLGNGSFGAQQVINAGHADEVYATDLDGDGDADVLYAANDKIIWHENDGSGLFGSQHLLTTDAGMGGNPSSNGSSFALYTTDLDGDGDADVLSASEEDEVIAWYENRLNDPTYNDFGPRQSIDSGFHLLATGESVYATDLDGDGDADVLAQVDLSHPILTDSHKVIWYQNQGGGTFGSQQVITTNVIGVRSVYAADLDGDGDADVLSASAGDNKIAWYENTGGGTFGAQQVITTNAYGARSVYATDLDGDGDTDVIYTGGNNIFWHENLGGGSFAPLMMISSNTNAAWGIYTADLDGDGDTDVLSASSGDNKIAWYENGFSIEMDETATFDLNIDWGRGAPAAQYYAFYSIDSLNNTSPGTGFVAGLHISFPTISSQLSGAIAGDPFFGGILDANGSATVTYNQPGLAALQGITVWGVAIQVSGSISGGYEASSIKRLTFL